MPLRDVTVKNWTQKNAEGRIRALLERERITQQTLAVSLGVSVSTVARWCGGVGVPDVRSRVALQRMIDKKEA